jgi:hypothetical protein
MFHQLSSVSTIQFEILSHYRRVLPQNVHVIFETKNKPGTPTGKIYRESGLDTIIGLEEVK